jgi:hypothetical protein
MVGGGVVFLWSGLTGKSWSAVLKDVIQGKNPKNLPKSQAITATPFTGNAYGYSPGVFPGNPPIGSVSGKNNQQIAQSMFPHYGWGPGELIPLVALWTGESGWNPLARNSTSGAFGIAQALGHGVPGGAASNGTNEYGGWGLTVAQARQANEGNPVYQIMWGLNYIHQTYGSPSRAYAAWQSRSPHWY